VRESRTLPSLLYQILTMSVSFAAMANYIRPRATGASVFFTVALEQRGAALLVDHVARLREAVAVTKAERPFEIQAWVVLPDHLHCVWTLPGGDGDFSTRWRLIKARFSRALPAGHLRRSHVARQERGIWQRRFWEHHIRDQSDMAAHVRYCWTDPVKHGLVDCPRQWPYSSIHRDLR
jgi:putative transposase